MKFIVTVTVVPIEQIKISARFQIFPSDHIAFESNDYFNCKNNIQQYFSGNVVYIAY